MGEGVLKIVSLLLSALSFFLLSFLSLSLFPVAFSCVLFFLYECWLHNHTVVGWLLAMQVMSWLVCLYLERTRRIGGAGGM